MALIDTAVRKAKSKKKAHTLSDIDGLSLYIDPKGFPALATSYKKCHLSL